jgi:hypothetical protein
MSILKEILQSQEECLHSMSVCKDMVSTISTSSLATFNATNIITHTPPHYHQPLTQHFFYPFQPSITTFYFSQFVHPQPEAHGTTTTSLTPQYPTLHIHGNTNTFPHQP